MMFVMRFFRFGFASYILSAVLVAILISTVGLSPAFARKAKEPHPAEPADPVMDIIRVRSAVVCEPICAEWLSVEGRIDATGPKRLRTAIKELQGRRLPIVLQSVGGDVEAAMTMGKMIREAGLPVYIGGTILSGCINGNLRCNNGTKVDNTPIGIPYAVGAVCFSACPILMAGGVERKSSDWALVGVHQVTTSIRKVLVQYKVQYRIVHGKKKVISEKEIGRKSMGVDYTTEMRPAFRKKLDIYWKNMGVSPQVTNLMLGTKPQDIHVINPNDLLDLKLASGLSNPNTITARNLCPDNPIVSYCVKRPKP